MARPTLRSILCGAGTAVVLVAAAACGGAVDEASQAGGIARPAEEGDPPADDRGSTADGSDGGGSDGGGSDPESPDDGPADGSDDGSSGGPDVGAGGAGARPGGPFDIAAFEQVGVSYADFVEQFAGACDGGVCSLSYDVAEDPGREEGCAVAGFSYDPPAQPDPDNPGKELIQRGTAVTVAIGCAPGSSPEDAATAGGEEAESPDDGSAEEDTTDEDTTDDGTTDGTTDDEPSDESPTDDSTTEDGTTDDGTTDDGTTDDGTGEEGG